MCRDAHHLDAWQRVFFEIVKAGDMAKRLRMASLQARLGEWTKALTEAVVATCHAAEWDVAAKGHPLSRMPEVRHEYLSIDAVAFQRGAPSWPFPVAVLELENSSRDDKIAYSLWKVMCVNASLRVVFCYRPSIEQGPDLVKTLEEEVVRPIPIENRVAMNGETVIALGYRNQAETFPYGFFRWWLLDQGTGSFSRL